MSYAVAIEALADPTRRKLVSRVRRRELTVGALARALRISQPAVSQHLACSRRARLVRERREGTRHYFAAAAAGLEPLRRYFESFWDDVLGAFAGRPARGNATLPQKGNLTMAPSPKPIPPLHRSITVPWSQEASFRRFTAEIATWWPLRTHSCSEDRAETVVLEGRVGGRLVEKVRGGEEHTWGTVTAWDPPRRVAFTWHPGQSPETSQDVEVTFTAGRRRHAPRPRAHELGAPRQDGAARAPRLPARLELRPPALGRTAGRPVHVDREGDDDDAGPAAAPRRPQAPESAG